MKTFVLAAALAVSLAFTAARADESLVPAPINELLRQVTPLMPLPELRSLIAKAYPDFAGGSFNLSGGGGNQEYRLNERYSLSVAIVSQDGVYVVHPALSFGVIDRTLEQSVWFSRVAWHDPTAAAARKELAGEKDQFDASEVRLSVSKDFWKALAAAESEVDASRNIEPLLALLPRFTRQAEQANLEYTLGRNYGQRTGVVNPGKSVDHLTKALALGLPLIRQLEALSWRSGSLEQLEKFQTALADQLRVLLRCSYFDFVGSAPVRPGLSKVSFKDPAKGQVGIVPAEGSPDVRDVSELDEGISRQAILREEELRKWRYYAIDAVKRLQKSGNLDDSAVVRQLEVLTTDRRKDGLIIAWLHGKNERPWP